MIDFLIHMICEAPPSMFDSFSGSHAPSGVLPARAKQSSAMYDPKHELGAPSRLPTKPLHQASLHLKISSGPERLTTKHTMEHNMSPRHSTVWIRLRLDKKHIGQHPDESVLHKSGESTGRRVEIV